MKLETKRLILRIPIMKDINDLIENINDLNVSKYLLVVAYPYTKKDAKWWINHCKEEANEEPRKSYGFNIELKSKKRIIGGVGLSKVNEEQGTAEIGYWLGGGHHRQGIMSEAVETILNFAFKKLKLRRIEAEVFAGNQASSNLLKKFGFKFEGLKRRAVKAKATGKIHDAEIYGLLKEEWVK